MATNNAINAPLPIVVAQGGTGSASTTAYAVLCGGTTSTAPLQPIASIGTAGQVLVSNGAAALPTFQSMDILTWNNVTGGTQALVANNGYIMSFGSLVTATLPAAAAMGTTIRIVGNAAGLYTILENTGQQIKFGTAATTVTTGSITSTNANDCLELICVVADTDWVVTSSIGNLTVA